MKILSSKLSRAFTLVELLVAVAIVAIIIGIGVPALRNSWSGSQATTADANAKTINEAIYRARDLDGDSAAAIATTATDVEAAVTHLVQENYIRSNN